MKKIGFLTLLIMATLLFTLAFPAAAAGPKAASACPGRSTRANRARGCSPARAASAHR